MLKVIELFAGIGAQREALIEAGIEHEIVGISEIDKYAVQAYELLHGTTVNFGDIKKIDSLPLADMWTYSFPCTDISLAGRMHGFEKGSETHSSLLWEVERLLEVSNQKNTLPKYLIMENVKNLISKRFIDGFRIWMEYLENLGYSNYYKVLNAKDYGIPQNRERVFMISIKDNTKQYTFPTKETLNVKLVDFLESNVDEKYYLSEKLIKNFSSMENRNGFVRGARFRVHDENSEYAFTITTRPGSRATDNFIMIPEATKKGYAIAYPGDGIYTNRTKSKRGVVQKAMIPTLKTSVHDLGVVLEEDELIRIRRLTPRECLRLMGWKDERIKVIIESGISNTQLYKMAGNSIVIGVLEKILLNLNEKNTR